MKTLIALFLALSVAQAQEVSEDTLVFHATMRHYIESGNWPPPNFAPQAPPKHDCLNALVAAWDRYEKECWADSTKDLDNILISYDGKVWMKTHRPDFSHAFSPSTNYMRPAYKRRTPTFSGFISWLRKEGR